MGESVYRVVRDDRWVTENFENCLRSCELKWIQKDDMLQTWEHAQ